jgi:hypothetical protein
VAHIFLFVIFMAEIAYLARGFENPLFVEEMNIIEFLRQPDVTLIQALLLKFKPVNMDILPVYIVLLVGFPPVLWLLLRRPTLALAGSVALYAVAHHFDWGFPSYPSGYWIINPFNWQLLFVFAAWCGLYGAGPLSRLVHSPVVLGLAAAYLLFAFAIVMTWHFPRLGHFVPRWLADFMYPIDKTNLDVLRFAHFLALAVVVVRFVPRDWALLKSPLLRPAIRCGENSLEIFCLGVFLSFAGHFAMVEISSGIAMQVAISVLGIVIMSGVAALMTWYKSIESRSAGPRQRSRDVDLAGGEA